MKDLRFCAGLLTVVMAFYSLAGCDRNDQQIEPVKPPTAEKPSETGDLEKEIEPVKPPTASVPAEPSDKQEIADYFPMHVGDEWHYRENRLKLDHTVRITGTKQINGNTYYVFEEDDFNARYVREAKKHIFYARFDKDNNIIAHYQYKNKEYDEILYKLNAPKGDKWTTRLINPWRGQAEVLNVNAEISVPAGSFDNALEISYSWHTDSTSGESYLLVKKVGVVAIYMHHKTNINYVLVSATVNGKEYPCTEPKPIEETQWPKGGD